MFRTNKINPIIFIKKWWPILLILTIEIILFIKNYVPDSFLVGWDNLYPELNFGLNIKRDFFAIWQEYRGLGLIDGMSHAANLINDFERLILSFFLPLNLIRWFYIFAMHFFGGIGMYMLCSLIKEKENKTISKTLAFIGAIIYQFNLGTIQQFFLPFEVFLVHFAFLPWIFYWAIIFIQHGKRKDLILLFIFSLLATGQAHVPTVFLVFLFSFLIYLTVNYVTHGFTNASRYILILIVIFFTNAFWGIPFFYSTLTNSKIITESKNFQMSSNDIFYRNKKFGNITSVALVKGIPLDYKYYNYKTRNYQFMMLPWLDHIQKPQFFVTAWLMFLLVITGVYFIFKRRRKKYYGFVFLYLFSVLMMGTDIPLISNVSDFLRKTIPLFSTIFRFVFTKFSIVYVFSYTIMLIIGLTEIVSFLKKQYKPITLIILLCAVFSYTKPSFNRHFFYENLAVQIPEDYFRTFNFFSQENPKTRIASLPIPWYWAWMQPDWGTIGSGFVWYGIPQPITDLAFTPWSDKNENFYWELEQAIYSKNSQTLFNVFKKYDITYVFLDKNIVLTQGKKFTYEDYENLLTQTTGIKLLRKFGKISIYELDSNQSLNNFVGIRNHLINIGPAYSYNNQDTAYEKNSDYITDNNNSYDIYFPFRSLFTGKDSKDIGFQITEDENNLYLSGKLLNQLNNQFLVIPNIGNEEFQVFNNPDLGKKSLIEPQIYLNGQLIYSPTNSKTNINHNLIGNDKNVLTFVLNKKLSLFYEKDSFSDLINNACDKNSKGIAMIDYPDNQGKSELELTSRNSHNCVKFNLPGLSHNLGYLIKIKSQSDKQRGFFFNLYNETTQKPDIETYFNNDGLSQDYYLIQPPKDKFGLGYTIYMDNLSEGTEKVTNILKEIQVYQIPFEFLKNLKLVNDQQYKSIPDSNSDSIEINQINSSLYSAAVNTGNQLLYLSQSYNSGWKAYYVSNKNFFTVNFPFLFGKEIKEHVLINNWANGWKIGQNQLNQSKSVKSGTNSTDSTNLTNLTIIFWPQYLEFIGFFLLIAGFIFMIKYKYES